MPKDASLSDSEWDFFPVRRDTETLEVMSVDLGQNLIPPTFFSLEISPLKPSIP